MKPDIDISAFFASLGTWVNTFVPIAAIGIGISIAIAVVNLVAKEMTRMFQDQVDVEVKRKNEDTRLEELGKRKNEDLFHEEKPKRQESHFELGDDGELFEVIDDQEASWK